jgi:hypothetical protein
VSELSVLSSCCHQRWELVWYRPWLFGMHMFDLVIRGNRRLQARRDSHMVVKPKNLESSLWCYFISNCHYRLFLFLELKFECLGRYNIKTCYLCETDLSWHPNKLTVLWTLLTLIISSLYFDFHLIIYHRVILNYANIIQHFYSNRGKIPRI